MSNMYLTSDCTRDYYRSIMITIYMKKILLTLQFAFFYSFLLQAQVYKITYQSYRDGNIGSQDPIVVIADHEKSIISRKSILEGTAIPTYEETFIHYKESSILRRSTLKDRNKISTFETANFNRYEYDKSNDTKTILNYKVNKAKTSINSNNIELWYADDLGINVSPTEVGLPLGLVLEYSRNGNSGLIATHIEKLNDWPVEFQFTKNSKNIDVLTYRDLLWKDKFIHIPIFKNERIRFEPGIKSDSVLRFAEGTVILKKIKVPEIQNDGQAFIQLIEKSSGDAYDRTGSVFLIGDDQKLSMLSGMQDGMKSLPKYDIGDGKEYLGMHRTSIYSPVYELMRFFTPFGVSHFNNRLQLKDKHWQDSVIYRQDISEFINVISGKEVYIGTYIGNYDKGGHTVNLELTIHPGDSNYAKKTSTLSLFNTTNIMEMGGQTYATLFGNDKGLEFEFKLDKDLKNVRLRYITTGHGGWWNGDEFVPKRNSIYIDDKLVHSFVPWRVDCGSYRLYNPVSGNFESGLSSSDLSRSNWCPGTITYPNYIDLGDMKAGKHKIKIHIPQGAPEGDSFSFWNVSGALLYDE